MGSWVVLAKNQNQAKKLFYKYHGKRWVITKVYPTVSPTLRIRAKPKKGWTQPYYIRYRMNKRRR